MGHNEEHRAKQNNFKNETQERQKVWSLKSQ